MCALGGGTDTRVVRSLGSLGGGTDTNLVCFLGGCTYTSLLCAINGGTDIRLVSVFLGVLIQFSLCSTGTLYTFGVCFIWGYLIEV